MNAAPTLPPLMISVKGSSSTDNAEHNQGDQKHLPGLPSDVIANQKIPQNGICANNFTESQLSTPSSSPVFRYAKIRLSLSQINPFLRKAEKACRVENASQRLIRARQIKFLSLYMDSTERERAEKCAEIWPRVTLFRDLKG